MFGEYAGYIIPAYALSGLAFAGLVVWSVLDHRARRGELAELERQGHKRRSHAGKGAVRADGRADD